MLKELRGVPYAAVLKAILNKNFSNRAKDKKSFPMELRNYRVTILKSFVHVTCSFTENSALGETWKLITKTKTLSTGTEEVIYQVLAALIFDMEDKTMNKNADIVRSLTEQYLLGALTIQYGKVQTLLPDTSAKECRYGYADALAHKVSSIENRIKLRGAQEIEDVSNMRKQTHAANAIKLETNLNSSMLGRPKLEGGTPGEWNRVEISQSEGASDALDILPDEEDEDEVLDTPIFTGPQKKLEEITVAGVNEPDDSWIAPNKETTMSDDLKLDFDKEHTDPTVAANILVAEKESEHRMQKDERERQKAIFIEQENANREFIERERLGQLKEGETMPYPKKEWTEEGLMEAYADSAKVAKIRKDEAIKAEEKQNELSSNIPDVASASTQGAISAFGGLSKQVKHSPPFQEGPKQDADQIYFEQKVQRKAEETRAEVQASIDAKAIEDCFVKIDPSMPDRPEGLLPNMPGNAASELNPAEIESMVTDIIDLDNPEAVFLEDEPDFQLAPERDERECPQQFAGRMQALLNEAHEGDMDEATVRDIEFLSSVNVASMDAENNETNILSGLEEDPLDLELVPEALGESEMSRFEEELRMRQGVWDTNVFVEEAGKRVQTHINRSNEEPMPIIYHADGRVTDEVGTPLVQFEGEYVRTTSRAFSNYLLANKRFLENGILLDYETYEIIYLKSILGSTYACLSDEKVVEGLKRYGIKVTGDVYEDRVNYEVAAHKEAIYNDRWFDHTQFTSKGTILTWSQNQRTEEELMQVQEGKVYKGLYGFVDYDVDSPLCEQPERVWHFMAERDCCLAELLETMVDVYPESLLLNARFETAPTFSQLHYSFFSGTLLRRSSKHTKVYGNKSTSRLVEFVGIDANVDPSSVTPPLASSTATFDQVLKYSEAELSHAIRFFHGGKTFSPVDKVEFDMVEFESALELEEPKPVEHQHTQEEVLSTTKADEVEVMKAKLKTMQQPVSPLESRKKTVEEVKNSSSLPLTKTSDALAVKMAPYVEPTHELTVEEEVDQFINNFVPPVKEEVEEKEPNMSLLDFVKPRPEYSQFMDIATTFDLGKRVFGRDKTGQKIVGVTHNCKYKNANALLNCSNITPQEVQVVYASIIHMYLMTNVQYGAFAYCPGVLATNASTGLLVRRETAQLGLRQRVTRSGPLVYTNGLPVLENTAGQIYTYLEEEELINGVVSNGLLNDYLTNDTDWEAYNFGEFKTIRNSIKERKESILKAIADAGKEQAENFMVWIETNPNGVAASINPLWNHGLPFNPAVISKSDPKAEHLFSQPYYFERKEGMSNKHIRAERKRYFPVVKEVVKVERQAFQITLDNTVMISFTSKEGKTFVYPAVLQSETGLKATGEASLSEHNINVGYESEILVVRQGNGKLLEVIVRKEKVVNYREHAGKELYVEPITIDKDEGAVVDIEKSKEDGPIDIELVSMPKSFETVKGTPANVVTKVTSLDRNSGETKVYNAVMQTAITPLDVNGQDAGEIRNMVEKSKSAKVGSVSHFINMVKVVEVINPAAAKKLNAILTTDINKALVEVTPHLRVHDAAEEFGEMVDVLGRHGLARVTLGKLTAQWRKYAFEILKSDGEEVLVLNERVALAPLEIEHESVVVGKVNPRLTPDLYGDLMSALASTAEPENSSMLITMTNGKIAEVIREALDPSGEGIGSIRVRAIYTI